MTTEQLLFLKLGEECAELAQRCSKLIQFGPDDVEPGQLQTNLERLQYERLDVLAIGRMLEERGLVPYAMADDFQKHLDMKRAKVEKFMEYARNLGRIE